MEVNGARVQKGLKAKLEGHIFVTLLWIIQ